MGTGQAHESEHLALEGLSHVLGSQVVCSMRDDSSLKQSRLTFPCQGPSLLASISVGTSFPIIRC